MVPFPPPGEYTVAFTCQADLDEVLEPENGDGGDEAIVFQQPSDRTVVAGETTECNFVP